MLGNVILQWLKAAPRRRLDKERGKVLREMLEDERFPGRWRKLSTLSRVIGASDETTKRLLIEIGARGSEQDDGLWGLIKHHPFRDTTQ
jgi:hypothetical protein